MKIGLIGLGKWGKIILNTLIKIGVNDIILYDNNKICFEDLGAKYPVANNYIDMLNCDKILIATPAKTHYTICSYFLNHKIDVFCEKPLCLNIRHCKKLYKLANRKNAKLFVDWVFTFNNEINLIKCLYKKGDFGEPISIYMNRLNYGPARTDVNARWDLAIHDISIIHWIFKPKKLLKSNWHDYNNFSDSYQKDSVLGLLKFDCFNTIINSSWCYNQKDRLCKFNFEKALVIWDDTKQHIIINGNKTNTIHNYTPLENSINTFFNFNQTEFEEQIKLTMEIMRSIL